MRFIDYATLAYLPFSHVLSGKSIRWNLSAMSMSGIRIGVGIVNAKDAEDYGPDGILSFHRCLGGNRSTLMESEKDDSSFISVGKIFHLAHQPQEAPHGLERHMVFLDGVPVGSVDLFPEPVAEPEPEDGDRNS